MFLYFIFFFHRNSLECKNFMNQMQMITMHWLFDWTFVSQSEPCSTCDLWDVECVLVKIAQTCAHAFIFVFAWNWKCTLHCLFCCHIRMFFAQHGWFIITSMKWAKQPRPPNLAIHFVYFYTSRLIIIFEFLVNFISRVNIICDCYVNIMSFVKNIFFCTFR